MSLNQSAIDKIKAVKLKIKFFSPYSNPWKDKTAEVVRLRRLIDVYIGHGEGDTK
jgi:hypothetical protein